jgi:hypothetical protein
VAICGGKVVLVQADQAVERWRSLSIKGCEGQLLTMTEILEILRDQRADSILDISPNHCAMLDCRLIFAQREPILGRLGEAVTARIGLSPTQEAMFEGRMRGCRPVKLANAARNQAQRSKGYSCSSMGDEPEAELTLDYDEWLARPISRATLTFT